MADKARFKPYRIIGAYDSETSNLISTTAKKAFPILHQIGLLDTTIEQVTSTNVEDVTRIYLYRHTIDLYEMLERIASKSLKYVPVIACHNLSFDMYNLASFFEGKNVRVLAKSRQKPITFTILDDEDNPRLVVWDTLVFSQKSLSYMGQECNYSKLTGAWDYDLIRTPETPLTERELDYAKHDIYSLLAWLGYWCRLNPDIKPSLLANRVLTKTGVVRQRRLLRFGKLKGKTLKRNVNKNWSTLNYVNKFKSDDELFTCVASTRGGFTFIAKNNANRVFDLKAGRSIYGYDATSQHPAQIVTHKYPTNFKQATSEELDIAFNIVENSTFDDVLNKFYKPFPVAFYGLFEFENLRLKEDTIYSKLGISTLASARCSSTYSSDSVLVEENEQGEVFKSHLHESGYHDSVIEPEYAYGKLMSAKVARLYITELTAFEISKVFDFDSVRAIGGYITSKFIRPSDLATISVMQFYDAKNEFKQAREKFYNREKIENLERLKELKIPDFVIAGMSDYSIDASIVESTYLGLKADLNALFGIEACNEYRRDTLLTHNGIDYEGEQGIENEPKQNKAFYQFGQRIVGWSRIAQLIVIELVQEHIDTIVNGDTDSLKFLIQDNNVEKVNKSLKRFNKAIDASKKHVCYRVEKQFSDYYSSLDEIGYYVLEFKVQQFCAGWNKAYVIRELDKRDGREHFKFTLAGVPAKHVNELADELYKRGWSFGDICDRLLGYNTTFAYNITNLHARSFPQWGEIISEEVSDYTGVKSRVIEPASLALYPMTKTLNDTRNKDNHRNMLYSLHNRETVKVNSCLVTSKGIYRQEDLIHGRANIL